MDLLQFIETYQAAVGAMRRASILQSHAAAQPLSEV